jgi:hypothetical protein
MTIVKQKMKKIIESLPDDASYEEIICELAFERMIERGLIDVRNGRVMSDETMKHRIGRSFDSNTVNDDDTLQRIEMDDTFTSFSYVKGKSVPLLDGGCSFHEQAISSLPGAVFYY